MNHYPDDIDCSVSSATGGTLGYVTVDRSTGKPGIDELVAALGVCAKHGLDLLNDEHVAMPVALPEERAIHIIAYAADITPAQLIRAWDAIHAHIKNGGAS